jgi:DNA-binding PadR family transcriptional regulator
MPAIHELRGIQRDLLFIISGLAEPNGQEIRAEMERSLTGDVQQGRIYSNLDDLVEEGFVEKGHQNGRTNCYTLTERGLAVIESRHEWERRYLDAPDPS